MAAGAKGGSARPRKSYTLRVTMNSVTVLLVLLAAALLEAGGDALVRSGMRAGPAMIRGAFFALGALSLFGYGYLVNAPAWDFGRLLGVYVVFFFVVAQLIAWFVFHQRPGNAVIVGGAFILAGGIIITLGRA
jgi:drug/metabolite transporter superfamily protein YnfA